MSSRSVDFVSFAHAQRGFDLRALVRRQPALMSVACVFLLAMLATALAGQFDTRTVNGIDIWVKPTKFLFSISIYFATLAFYFGYLPVAAQRSRAGMYIIWGSISIGVLEMLWLVSAAVAGVPAHFNRDQWQWSVAYGMAGAGASGMLVAILLQGRMIARDSSVALSPAFRSAIHIGAWVAFVTTLATAYTLAAGTGHWVGGVRSDAGGLPLFGWSRDGGDLRVAHFWALHSQQLIPFATWLVADKLRLLRGTRTVLWITLLYTLFIIATFVQAILGQPFLG